MAVKFFIVEDNHDIGFILGYYLTEEGFDVSLFPTISAFKKVFSVVIPGLTHKKSKNSECCPQFVGFSVRK